MTWVRPSLYAVVCVGALGCAASEDDAGQTGTGGSSGGGKAGAGAGSGTGGSAIGGTSSGGDAGVGATAGSSSGGSAGSGGAGGSAGSSGSGGASGGSGGSAGCPVGKGPSMIQVGAQCVDSTEVTNAHYAQFLAAKVTPQSTTKSPAHCSWNTTFTPSQGWPATGKDAYPVVYVDWCDALAYCQWAGKRLCGAVGGGALPYGDYADANKSQWLYACSGKGTKKYPYGDIYDGKACNGVTTAPVRRCP